MHLSLYACWGSREIPLNLELLSGLSGVTLDLEDSSPNERLLDHQQISLIEPN